MDSNQNSTFSIFNNTCWNHEKTGSETDHNVVVHEQIIPMGSLWGPNFPFQIPSSSSSSSSSSSLLTSTCSGFLHDMLGIQSKLEDQEGGEEEEEEAEEELGAMKEMMYKIAAMQPVDIDPATIRKPKRRNVRISDDPQSVAARHRRERISEKIRILQRLVPGGTKMDTASMLDEAIRYVKFLKRQVRLLQSSPHPQHPHPQCIPAALGLITNTNNAASPTHHWPFAPNLLQYHTATTSSSTPMSIDTAAALGFNGGGGGGPAHHTSSFNHEVISD